MPRKNNNAGQLNRAAQKDRRAVRIVNDKTHRDFRKVLGPGSESLVRTPIIEPVEELHYA